jgi:hypothetical protein
MRGLARFVAGWVGVLALLGLFVWKLAMWLNPGMTLAKFGVLAFWIGVALFVLYVLGEHASQPLPRRVKIEK